MYLNDFFYIVVEPEVDLEMPNRPYQYSKVHLNAIVKSFHRHVKIEWMKNHAPLDTYNLRYDIKRNTEKVPVSERLTIKKVDGKDNGTYSVKVTTKAGNSTMSKEMDLEVQGGIFFFK